MKIGMIFPGQGAQYVGMIKELYDEERVIQELFEQASMCLSTNFVKLCFASSDREISTIANSHTTVLLVSICLQELLRIKYGIIPDVVAGYSVGEYTALHAASFFSFVDALYLAKKRALILEDYLSKSKEQYANLEVLGITPEKGERLCQEYKKEENSFLEISAHYSPRHYTITGEVQSLKKLKSDLEILGASTSFFKSSFTIHTSAAHAIRKDFVPYFNKVSFKDLTVPCATNAQGNLVIWKDEALQALTEQTDHAVAWWKGMQHFKDADLIIEIGPDKKLSSDLSSVWPNMSFFSINDQQDIDALIYYLNTQKYEFSI